MKRFVYYLFLVFEIYALNFAFAQEQIKNRTIVLLDPGHGGTDTGAIGVNGIREKDIVLGIAKEVIRLNGELYSDTLEFYLTRYSDTLISLGYRTKLAKGLEADLFLSIHCNQAARTAAQGVEVYVYRENRHALELAQELSKGLNHKLGFKNRGVKQGNFQVLGETEGLCPSVLLELGFLSNKEEARHNSKPASITAYALLILETLITYCHD